MESFDEKINNILSSPEAMGKIMNMAQSLGSAGPAPNAAAGGDHGEDEGGGDFNPLGALGGLDPQMIGKAMELMSVYNTPDDDRATLLKAIKPYLRNERWGKVEKASQYMKLARVAKVAMRDLFKGE